MMLPIIENALLVVSATSLLVNAYLAMRLQWQKRQKQKVEHQNTVLRQQTQQQEQVINDVKTRKEIAHDAYRMDADELDKRLQQDYRD